MIAHRLTFQCLALYVYCCLGDSSPGSLNVMCPLKLIEVKNSTNQTEAGGTQELVLNTATVNYLAGLPSPLYLVPMAGVYRSGKSMLMNRLMGLSAPYTCGFGVDHNQETFTRGIDVRAEPVAGLGTVVWMDTEGLFSSEEAHSFYGPKLFSLALLFSSTVLLNSVKVFSEQFFSYFGEQQQFARMLKDGLVKEGLPLESLLPAKLSIHWLVQQPIRYDPTASQTAKHLEDFLKNKNDDTRSRVRESFEHIAHEVPVASNDYTAWGQLDKIPDSELTPSYTSSTKALRENILTHLRTTKGMHATAIERNLKLFVLLVQSKKFSGKLARQTLMENEGDILCSDFRQSAKDFAGSLPSRNMSQAIVQANESIAARRSEVVGKLHLLDAWSKKLDKCIADEKAELERQNGLAVLEKWEQHAAEVAQTGRCYVLNLLSKDLQDWAIEYGASFTPDLQAKSIAYAQALQKTKFVECVRLGDVIWPLAPFLLAVLCFLGFSLVTVAIAMATSSGSLWAIYISLRTAGYIPDIFGYPILREHPLALWIFMSAPPFVPWESVAWAVFYVACVTSALLVLTSSLTKGSSKVEVILLVVLVGFGMWMQELVSSGPGNLGNANTDNSEKTGDGANSSFVRLLADVMEEVKEPLVGLGSLVGEMLAEGMEKGRELAAAIAPYVKLLADGMEKGKELALAVGNLAIGLLAEGAEKGRELAAASASYVKLLCEGMQNVQELAAAALASGAGYLGNLLGYLGNLLWYLLAWTLTLLYILHWLVFSLLDCFM